MKRFLIFVILLLSLSAVFATEEQVFALLDTLTKERPTTHERLTEIFQENMFIPLPPDVENKILLSNYFNDTRVEAKYYITPNKVYVNDVFSIDFVLNNESDKEFITNLQKIIKFLDSYFSRLRTENYSDVYKIRYEYTVNNEKSIISLWYKPSAKTISVSISLTT